jgi:hypothetical protein
MGEPMYENVAAVQIRANLRCGTDNGSDFKGSMYTRFHAASMFRMLLSCELRYREAWCES